MPPAIAGACELLGAAWHRNLRVWERPKELERGEILDQGRSQTGGKSHIGRKSQTKR